MRQDVQHAVMKDMKALDPRNAELGRRHTTASGSLPAVDFNSSFRHPMRSIRTLTAGTGGKPTATCSGVDSEHSCFKEDRVAR